jgi:hypothetical protein
MFTKPFTRTMLLCHECDTLTRDSVFAPGHADPVHSVTREAPCDF